jgi:hypothetical protein
MVMAVTVFLLGRVPSARAHLLSPSDAMRLCCRSVPARCTHTSDAATRAVGQSYGHRSCRLTHSLTHSHSLTHGRHCAATSQLLGAPPSARSAGTLRMLSRGAASPPPFDGDGRLFLPTARNWSTS